MNKKRKLTRKEAISLYNALKMIQMCEVDKKTEDGSKVIEVVALPPKTAYYISQQIGKLEAFSKSYDDAIQRFAKEANEAVEKEKKEGKNEIEPAQKRFSAAIEAFNAEVEMFETIEKPFKFSSDPTKSDFGKVQLKSQVLELLPDWFFDWIE